MGKIIKILYIDRDREAIDSFIDVAASVSDAIQCVACSTTQLLIKGIHYYHDVDAIVYRCQPIDNESLISLISENTSALFSVTAEHCSKVAGDHHIVPHPFTVDGIKDLIARAKPPKSISA
ncbi:MAG: hypothetical protein K6L81_02680 [Agarilytica sp.]